MSKEAKLAALMSMKGSGFYRTPQYVSGGVGREVEEIGKHNFLLACNLTQEKNRDREILTNNR